jgi:DNA-directed RNA polymerase specialized sigma24 family protein
LVWKIFKNKLRDKLRQKKRREKDYQEESYSEDFLISSHDSLEPLCPQLVDTMLEQENKKNPILTKLESFLDDLNDWERQLLICRANNIPYKVVEEMTGKKKDFLKVYYKRLKDRFAKKFKKSLTIKKRE